MLLTTGGDETIKSHNLLLLNGMADVKFWTLAGAGFTKIEQVQTRRREIQILVIL